MRKLRSFAACTMMALTHGCGGSLGDYRLEKVTYVEETAEKLGGVVPGYKHLIQIEVSSPTGLAPFSDKVDLLDIDADFCPITNERRFVALGPYDADGKERTFPEQLPYSTRNHDGRYWYRIFVVPKHPMPGVKYAKNFGFTRYDIRSQNRDICVRITSTGFSFERFRTNEIRISAATIAHAMEGQR